MRTFYVDVDIEGRSSHLRGGPTGQNEMSLVLTQRDKGSITTAFTIECIRDGDTLLTTVFDHDHNPVAEYKTQF